MGKYHCIYCGTTLTHDSLSVRRKHLAGRNHSRNVQIYWNTVSEKIGPSDYINPLVAPFSEPMNQSSELRLLLRIPGIDDDVEETLDKSTLPAPCNVPTARFPRNFLGSLEKK